MKSSSPIATIALKPLSLKVSTALTALAMASTAMAIEPIEVNILPQTQLDEITVTATRVPTLVNNTIAQTRVIDSEALKPYTGQSALEVLRRQPGFSYYQNGGMGTASNFYLRGYDKKSILVLIDGIRYSSVSAGGANLELLPADQIERIEILYGASGSSIYGADAMGGVIQIFTKGTTADSSNFSVTVGAGTHDHYLYGATAQLVNDEGTRLSLSASHNETDGINATTPDNEGTYNNDDDGFESNNYSLLLSQRFNDTISTGLSALYSESTTEFDSGATDGPDNTYADQKNGAAQAFIDWRYMPDASAKLSYGQSIDESDNPTYDSLYKSTQKQVSLIGTQGLPIGQAVYGVEHVRQEVEGFLQVYSPPTYEATTFDYSPDDRKVTSGFLGYIGSYNGIDGQANIRYDNYSDFNNKFTYNLGLAYSLVSELRVGANYARGYRVPTFDDLYYPDYSNPTLDPETSDNYEAFIEYDTGLQSTRITSYHNKVDDFILAKAPTYIPSNIYKAKIKGVTLTTDWFVDDYMFGASYDYQEAKNDSGSMDANDGNYLPIRPKNKGKLYAGYQLHSLDMRAEYEYVGDYYSGIDNLDSEKVEDYGLVNISGNYRLSPNVSITARLNNVFNKSYTTLPGYNSDGTNFMLSATYAAK